MESMAVWILLTGEGHASQAPIHSGFAGIKAHSG